MSAQCTVVEEGSGEERPCRFPFVYRGVARCGCIRTGHPEGRRWCSTRIDEEDDGHVSGGGFYGVCRDGRRDCPVGNDDEEEALAGDDELRSRPQQQHFESITLTTSQICFQRRILRHPP